mgnify:CR=1 FL=1
MSYISQLRNKIGNDLILLPGSRIIILNKKGEILLQKRSDFNLWGLPGGCPEENESISECIIRETYEETGLHLNSIIPFGHASDPKYEIVTYPNNDKIQNFSMLFYSEDYYGELINSNEESLELGWFNFENLPIVIENHKTTIQAFINYRKTGVFQMV